MLADGFCGAITENFLRSAIHDVMIPATVLLTIASSEDSMIAASSASVSNIRGFIDFPTRRIDLMAMQFQCLNPFMALASSGKTSAGSSKRESRYLVPSSPLCTGRERLRGTSFRLIAPRGLSRAQYARVACFIVTHERT